MNKAEGVITEGQEEKLREGKGDFEVGRRNVEGAGRGWPWFPLYSSC